ncbi:MAG: hypothetical protein ACK55I_09230, partial [bacterium]
VGVAAAGSAGTAFATHEVAEHVAHVGLDLLGIFAGFEALEGHLEVLGHRARGQDVLHLAQQVGHVPGVVLVEMVHVALHLRHDPGHPGIVEVGHAGPLGPGIAFEA